VILTLVLATAVLLVVPEQAKLQGSSCNPNGCYGSQFVCSYCIGQNCAGGLFGCTGPCGGCVEVFTHTTCGYNPSTGSYCPLPSNQWYVYVNNCS